MLVSQDIQCLSKACKDILFEEEMKKHSSVKIGGKVLFFACPRAKHELKKLLVICKKLCIRVQVVGNCSNILFDDSDMKLGVISTRNLKGIVISRKDATLEAMAGEMMASVFGEACKAGLSGFERLSGIPGTVGAAVRGNAGAFGCSIGELVSEVKVLLDSGRTKTIHAFELGFSYRKSELQKMNAIVVSVKFAMNRLAPSVIMSVAKECASKRKLSQPAEYSLGSVFKRHGEVPAGMLIDEAGFKGVRVGGCEVSGKHANFIVNTGEGLASDYKKLVQIVHAGVLSKFGIDLEREIEYIQ